MRGFYSYVQSAKFESHTATLKVINNYEFFFHMATGVGSIKNLIVLAHFNII